MLHSLHLKNVGPAPEMRLDLAQRLNLITGDNGLGKSFLLDVAWWALTRKWPHDLNPRLTSGYPARPTDLKKPASIGFELTGASRQLLAYESTYVTRDQAWTGRSGRALQPRARRLRPCRRRICGLGPRTQLLEKARKRRHSRSSARLRVLPAGRLGRSRGRRGP